MTEIKRYEMNHKGLPEPDDKGVWVFHEDHAAIVSALQEQVRALAAEGAIMHTAIDQTIGWQQWVDAGNTESVRCLVAIQGKTPRIDAALREIRAQAVNGFSEFCGDNSVFIKETCNYDSLAGAACIYLAHIREGDQS